VQIFIYILRGSFPHVNFVCSIFLFDVVRDGGKVFCIESRYFSGFISVLFVISYNFCFFYLRVYCTVLCIGMTHVLAIG
jgi:hypothetical protein